MVLAAGLCKRMRTLTATVPKPLIEVAGRALIDHCLDRLDRAGVETAVVNVHYLADLVRAHVSRRRRPKVIVSDERDGLLDTGGGIAKALPYLGGEPFYLHFIPLDNVKYMSIFPAGDSADSGIIKGATFSV